MNNAFAIYLWLAQAYVYRQLWYADLMFTNGFKYRVIQSADSQWPFDTTGLAHLSLHISLYLTLSCRLSSLPALHLYYLYMYRYYYTYIHTVICIHVYVVYLVLYRIIYFVLQLKTHKCHKSNVTDHHFCAHPR